MTDHEPPPAQAGLQFDHAEFEQPAPAAIVCAQCQASISDEYYEAGTRTVCGRCRQLIEAAFSGGSSVGRFVRAGLFGLVAGAAGTVLWYAVRKLTNGSEWGIIAIAVGWLVGAGVRNGSGARGGWLYQLLAVALTYISIASNYVPDALEALSQGGESGEGLAGPLLWIAAALLALVAPFLGGFANILGLLIIGFGLYQAWAMNKRVELRFAGPFRVGSAVPPPVANA